MNRGALINSKLVPSIAKTFLGRDPAMKLYRTAPNTYDTEGDYTGTEALVATFDGSLGMPTLKDQEVAAQRGVVLDAVMQTAPPTGFQFKVGDFIEARGQKWVIADVFTQIVTTCKLTRFGTRGETS